MSNYNKGTDPERQSKALALSESIHSIIQIEQKLTVLRDDCRTAGNDTKEDPLPPVPESLEGVLYSGPDAIQDRINKCIVIIEDIRNILF